MPPRTVLEKIAREEAKEGPVHKSKWARKNYLLFLEAKRDGENANFFGGLIQAVLLLPLELRPCHRKRPLQASKTKRAPPDVLAKRRSRCLTCSQSICVGDLISLRPSGDWIHAIGGAVGRSSGRLGEDCGCVGRTSRRPSLWRPWPRGSVLMTTSGSMSASRTSRERAGKKTVEALDRELRIGIETASSG